MGKMTQKEQSDESCKLHSFFFKEFSPSVDNLTKRISLVSFCSVSTILAMIKISSIFKKAIDYEDRTALISLVVKQRQLHY